MSNYIPHHTKKKQVLARKELALERLIAHREPIQKLIDAAEEVRDGRIRVLEARRSTIAPAGNADAQYQRIDEQIEELSNTSIDSILTEFGFNKADEDDS